MKEKCVEGLEKRVCMGRGEMLKRMQRLYFHSPTPCVQFWENMAVSVYHHAKKLGRALIAVRIREVCNVSRVMGLAVISVIKDYHIKYAHCGSYGFHSLSSVPFGSNVSK